MSKISHYYSKDNDLLKSNRQTITFQVKDQPFKMVTDAGVFSKKGLDFGTRVLLESIDLTKNVTVLDLGCGYGVIGIVLAKLFQATVTMIDINKRAIELSNENATTNNVAVTTLESDGLNQVNGLFDVIVTNPPIRAGKKVYYQWFEDVASRLALHGAFWVVIHKDQGAMSAIKHLNTIYSKVETVQKKSGYFVVRCQI